MTIGVAEEELARRVAELLDGRTIATAESCTAGRLAEVLACVEKATDFLRGGLVAYQDEIKRQLLGVTADSVLSIDAAKEMAVGALGLFGADVVSSVLGQCPKLLECKWLQFKNGTFSKSCFCPNSAGR